MPNWLFTILLINTMVLTILQMPGYAILILGAGIMYNGQYMVEQSKRKKDE